MINNPERILLEQMVTIFNAPHSRYKVNAYNEIARKAYILLTQSSSNDHAFIGEDFGYIKDGAVTIESIPTPTESCRMMSEEVDQYKKFLNTKFTSNHSICDDDIHDDLCDCNKQTFSFTWSKIKTMIESAYREGHYDGWGETPNDPVDRDWELSNTRATIMEKNES